MPNASHAPAGDALPAVFAAAGSRREFLRRMSLASAAPLAAGPLLAQLDDASAVKPGRKLKVVIAGAGLAGLCAAYELEKRGHEIGPLLNENFDLRRRLYKLSQGNIDMVEAARDCGASAKFTGSGGAIVGTYADEAMFQKLKACLEPLSVAVIKPQILPES